MPGGRDEGGDEPGELPPMRLARRMPPLSWVRAFEAAARHESFVAAARELSVTPGAVSRAVRELEGFMGVVLFVRVMRGVQLTNIARMYAKALAPAIRQIAFASAQMQSLPERSADTLAEVNTGETGRKPLM